MILDKERKMKNVIATEQQVNCPNCPNIEYYGIKWGRDIVPSGEVVECVCCGDKYEVRGNQFLWDESNNLIELY